MPRNKPKKNRFTTSMLFILILLSIAFAVIVNSLLTIPLPAGYRIVQNNDWIGFFGNLAGAFIGAAVTVFIFRETLQAGKKSESEARRLQVIPFLNVEMDIVPYSSIPLMNITWMFLDNNNASPHFAIKLNIINIGQGLATDFDIKIDGYGWTRQSRPVTFIQQNGKLEDYISLPIPVQENFGVTFRFQFIDILENQYEQVYVITIQNQPDSPHLIYSHRDRPKLIHTN